MRRIHITLSYGRYASIWLHLDTFLLRSGSGHLPKAMADVLPYGFIWTPFYPDLDQAIFETRYAFPKLQQICFRMASFGYLSVQIWIKPFSNTGTPSQSYGKCASIWLHLDTFLSRSGSGHFQPQMHLPKAMAKLFHMASFRHLLSTCRTHVGRHAASESTFEHIGNAFGSTDVEREGERIASFYSNSGSVHFWHPNWFTKATS